MRSKKLDSFSRRERQIMDILFAQGQATALEVLESLPDPPSYSSVRALLRVLEEKGHIRHARDGARYIYRPLQARGHAGRSALQQVLQTFFEGSVERVVATLLSSSEYTLSDQELSRLSAMIDKAKSEEKESAHD